MSVTCNVGRCSHSPSIVKDLKVASKRKNNYLNKRKIVSEPLLVWRGATGVPVLISNFCLLFRPRLKIANNPNFDSTSIHRSGATARMKTNMLKDNISIQFEVKLVGVLRVTFKLLLRIVPPLLRWMD